MTSHYLAPGKKNLIWHLRNMHNFNVPLIKEQRIGDLENKHKELHEQTAVLRDKSV